MNNINKTPDASLEKTDSKENIKYTTSKKFIISLSWVFPLFFISIATSTPKEVWLSGILGVLILCAGGCYLSAYIPSQKKLTFVGTSFFLTLGLAFLINLLITK